MSKLRKTVDVNFVLDLVNKMVQNSTCSSERRKGMEIVIEEILFYTGNYKGFRYLTSDEVPKDELPGINTHPLGSNVLSFDEKFANTDDTRRMYF